MIANSVNVGDKVLVPEYGGTKVIFDEQVRYCLNLNALISIFPSRPGLFLV